MALLDGSFETIRSMLPLQSPPPPDNPRHWFTGSKSAGVVPMTLAAAAERVPRDLLSQLEGVVSDAAAWRAAARRVRHDDAQSHVDGALGLARTARALTLQISEFLPGSAMWGRHATEAGQRMSRLTRIPSAMQAYVTIGMGGRLDLSLLEGQPNRDLLKWFLEEEQAVAESSNSNSSRPPWSLPQPLVLSDGDEGKFLLTLSEYSNRLYGQWHASRRRQRSYSVTPVDGLIQGELFRLVGSFAPFQRQADLRRTSPDRAAAQGHAIDMPQSLAAIRNNLDVCLQEAYELVLAEASRSAGRYTRRFRDGQLMPSSSPRDEHCYGWALLTAVADEGVRSGLRSLVDSEQRASAEDVVNVLQAYVRAIPENVALTAFRTGSAEGPSNRLMLLDVETIPFPSGPSDSSASAAEVWTRLCRLRVAGALTNAAVAGRHSVEAVAYELQMPLSSAVAAMRGEEGASTARVIELVDAMVPDSRKATVKTWVAVGEAAKEHALTCAPNAEGLSTHLADHLEHLASVEEAAKLVILVAGESVSGPLLPPEMEIMRLGTDGSNDDVQRTIRRRHQNLLEALGGQRRIEVYVSRQALDAIPARAQGAVMPNLRKLAGGRNVRFAVFDSERAEPANFEIVDSAAYQLRPRRDGVQLVINEASELESTVHRIRASGLVTLTDYQRSPGRQSR